MNILEINKFYYLRRGAERHLIDVINLFKSKGHHVAVFAMHHPKNISSKWEKFFVSYVGYNPEDSNLWQKLIGIGRIFWSFEAERNIENLLKEFRPDVVHLHNIYHQISPSILGPIKQTGAKVVMTVHDYNLVSPDKDAYYENVGKRYWKFLFVKKYGFFKRLLLVLKMYFNRHFGFYDLVDVFIAPSLYVKSILIRGGIDKNKIVVVPHFITGEKISVSIDSNTEEKYALYFGSISYDKGVADLVRIFDALQLPLVIAGSIESGFVFPESKYVKYVGQQSREQLEELIKKSSCVVSGSQLPETFGLIALESIAFGKPFFGLRSGAYSEIIENRKNGILANSFESLQEIVRKFFSGNLFFDSEVIQNDAFVRYGSDGYYGAWKKCYHRRRK